MPSPGHSGRSMIGWNFVSGQNLQLALKGLIRDARRLLDEKGGVPHGHNLVNLWNTAQPLLLRVEPKSRADLDNTGAAIGRLAGLDPTSQVFRYPVDVDGKPSLPKDLFHINLRQVRDVVERLSGLLDAADAHISALLDYKWDAEEEGREVEREMQREMLAEYNGDW